ncbi:redoxin family protein [Mycolicibacterium peregrinum]|nr:redoxin family protein [Mycolicibacterium peregrinum]
MHLARGLMAVTLLAGGMLSTASVAAADVPLLGNDQRLRFYGTELNGALFDGRTLIGRPVVIWFWTPEPNCPVCMQEAPVLAKAAADNPDVTFVGVAGRYDVLSYRRIVDRYGLNFTNLTDANGMLWQAFFVPWPPAWAFLSPDGSGYLINNITTPMSDGELADRVHALTGGQ